METMETVTSARLGQKRDALDKIVTSRKRKLQELYRVVNHVQTACTYPRTRNAVARANLDADGERKFLESADINLGKAFNAKEMLPARMLVVPEMAKEPVKPIAPATAHSGDTAPTVSKKEHALPEPTAAKKTSELLGSTDAAASSKSTGVTDEEPVEDRKRAKTPARKAVRQKDDGPVQSTLTENDVKVANRDVNTISTVTPSDPSLNKSQETAPDNPDLSKQVKEPTTSKPNFDSAPSSIPTNPAEQSTSLQSLDQLSTVSHKTEQPSLAISTSSSESSHDQIQRPFPTPTTATEAEPSIRPPTSVPGKSVSPPSPADSADAAEPEGSEQPRSVPPAQEISQDGVGQDNAADTHEMAAVDHAGRTSETTGPRESVGSVTSKSSAVDEAEKQLQLETALSKQQEAAKEDTSLKQGAQLATHDQTVDRAEPDDDDDDVEMEDASETIVNDSEETAEATEKASLVHASQNTFPRSNAPATEITTVENAKREALENPSRAPIPPASEKVSATGQPTDTQATTIKLEEQVPLGMAPTAEQPAYRMAAPRTPQPFGADSDVAAVESSAIAETPVSVDEAAGHFISPKSGQQPLTTAALESINTTASTPATRASSRREKRPSININGGLQLAKIVFHGRSTATASTSKNDVSSTDQSPSAAPLPPRVGTRSGSVSMPVRMNSRSLEAQRASSLSDSHQIRQSIHPHGHHPHKGASDKPKLDVFDYLTAVTASEPLQNSLATSHKTLSTSAFQLLRREKQAIQALTEIQDLQKQGKWSLTQPARAIEPPKRFVHWDYVINEAKWMSKDFKEDRKWNIVKAKKLADACVTWHNATESERRALCVRVVPPGQRNRHVTQVPTPDLMPSDEHSDDEDENMRDDEENEHMRDDFVHRLHEVENPGNLFALGADDIVFEILHNSMTDRMLGELPVLEAPKLIEGTSANGARRELQPPPNFFDGWRNNEPLGPSAGLKRTLWETPVEEGPPVKKSRFSYDPEYNLFDSDDEDEENRDPEEHIVASRGIARSGSPVLHPENTSVALFNPDFQTVLQRLHNAHPFRPPQEMPPATFFEFRAPSQWTAEEDKELVAAVRKYNHNWWLVSQVMQPRSFLQSGADRRSLWECFERWYMLDTQNQELIKGPFFKPVQQRLELAARAPAHTTVQQQQAANASASAVPGGASSTGGQNAGAPANTPAQQLKRRTSQPMRVERKRNTRAINMVEQMRKLAKKREMQANKQVQSTNIAIKKQQEQSAQAAAGPKTEQYTPQQVSRMKHERELLHRQQAQMAQMAQLQRRQQAQASQQQPQSQSQPAATQPAPTSTPVTATAPAAPQPGNSLPVQSKGNLQVPNVHSSPAAAAPTTAQQSILAAQQRSLLAAANANPAALQAATQQVNQQLRASGHTIATNGQNGPTSLTPEQYRMLIQARLQNNIKAQQHAQAAAQAQAQAQAQAVATAHGSAQVTSANASHIHAMQQAAAAARAHNSAAGQTAQVAASAVMNGTPPSQSVISPQAAMIRIKQHFPTIGDEYIQRVVMQHHAQAKQLGRELTYAHISNLISSLASQYQGNAAAAQQAQQQAVSAQQAAAQQAQQAQQQLAAAAAAAAHHQAQQHANGQLPQTPTHHAGVAHVGAGGIHHPHPPISRSGGSASTQQMLNQLMMSQTRAPSSSPMMGNATPVMSSAGLASRGSSATPMQRGGSYQTSTPGGQGSPRQGHGGGATSANAVNAVNGAGGQ
ncbi:hypothetical protein TWF696_007537 [Orbilia brochopaga]|uniref:Vacuolar import and degradation protein 21 n=1 Tax=Orbilia brochopaga TaxID=3140254 RepID=A0AAV9UKH1_9PEZI